MHFIVRGYVPFVIRVAAFCILEYTSCGSSSGNMFAINGPARHLERELDACSGLGHV
jgi:hypothetical protein